MLPATGRDLPPELIRLVIRACLELNEQRKPVKRGLAHCGQVCRYWARLTRPLLFEWLTLTGRADISQLLVFLNSPQILQRTIGQCIRNVDIVEDHALPDMDLRGDQLFGLQQLRQLCSHDLTITLSVKGGPVNDAPTLRPTPLPFSTLPRTLPKSITGFYSLSLYNLQLPSFKKLSKCIGTLGPRNVAFGGITFVEPAVPGELGRRRAARSQVREISVSPCVEDEQIDPGLRLAYGSPLELASTLTAFKQTLLALLPLASTSAHAPSLNVTHNPADAGMLEMCAMSLRGELTAKLSVVRRSDTETNHFESSLELRIPQSISDIADIPVEWDTLERSLLAVYGPNVPLLDIEISNRNCARSLLQRVFLGTLLPQLHAMQRLVLQTLASPRKNEAYGRWITLESEEIDQAPTRIPVDDGVLALSLSQRAEFLLCEDEDLEQAYLRRLARAHRAAVQSDKAASAAGTIALSPQVATSTSEQRVPGTRREVELEEESQ